MKTLLLLLFVSTSAVASSGWPPASLQRIPGYSSTTGSVAATDNIQDAISKLNGNSAAKQAQIAGNTCAANTFGTGINTAGTLACTQPTTANVSEVTNLYYTDARAIAAPLTGFAASAGVVAATDTILGAFNKLVGLVTNSNAIIFYGDGADGALAGGLGTTTLVRDMYYSSLTLSGSDVLLTSGYRVFVSGTCSLGSAPAGAIAGNGNAGLPGSGSGAAAGSSTVQANHTLSGAVQSGGGGAGTTGVGNQGTASSASTFCNGGAGGDGSAGGATGATAGGALKAGATCTNPLTIHRFFPQMMWGSGVIAGGVSGSGGGSGAGDGAVGAGGSSGGGGAIGVWISCATIARGSSSTAGIIQAKGATGGGPSTAASLGTNTSGGGGGGGGGGGYIVVNYGAVTGSTITNALDASGGAGGTGGNAKTAGTGKGGTGGGSGEAGRITVCNLTAGTCTETKGSAGAAGTAAVNTTGGAGHGINTFQANL